MSTAAEKAAARKAAILGRKNDRLKKLTTSARGEDSPVYVHDDPPLAPMPQSTNLRQFVGEDTMLPTPPEMSRRASDSQSPFSATGLGAGRPDPSIWSEEQQQQLLSALMGGANGPRSFPGQQPIVSSEDTALPEDNPLAALMSMMGPLPGGKDGAGMPPGMIPPNFFGPPQPPAGPAQKTLLQRIMPIIHFAAGWLLLAYFVLWKEPAAYVAQPHTTGTLDSGWRRWAELGWQRPEGSWGVQSVPFFWAFTTLTIVLHSWRIFNGVDPVQPPMLLALALPHLPPPLPSVILNGMKYLQIGSVFLDDIAILLFGIGLIVWIASWFVN